MASRHSSSLYRAVARSAAPRSLGQSTRGVATRSSASSASSSSSTSAASASGTRWALGTSAAALGLAAGIYSVQSRQAPVHLEGRVSWNDRLKPRESKGDAFLHKESHDHKPKSVTEELESAAEETPQAIEVAVEEIEEEDNGQQSAYNPDTGEINWDCPCLGGMAHGPCGEQFKAAFSCFVYSEAEPKGIDCVDKFKVMQDCFREHPDVYKDEIEDDDAANAAFEKEEAEATAAASSPAADQDETKSSTEKKEEDKSSSN